MRKVFPTGIYYFSDTHGAVIKVIRYSGVLDCVDWSSHQGGPNVINPDGSRFWGETNMYRSSDEQLERIRWYE